MKNLHILYILYLLCFLINSCKIENEHENQEAPQFVLLSADSTNVDFVNPIEDQEKLNILNYRNFYNGGGVGIGDINNDGLMDIYFTSNLSQNKLYLNKGDFKFEDITEKAGVGGTKFWSTGVSMADVNADGYTDIYVCNSGDSTAESRRNELFINQGNLTFKESAKEYGLDDAGFSTHAVFFDCDMDGDLDCFVLNNSYTDPQRIAGVSRNRNNYGAPGGDRLYNNMAINGQIKFVDVTKESGLFSGDIDFGLGVSVGDVNGDYWPDLFISNDFWERDYLYINQGNGSFKEELTDRTPYVSANSMGSDIADLNNDGHLDIFSTDMLPTANKRLKSAIKIEEYFLEGIKWRNSYFFQFVQNCLFANDGQGKFIETANYSGVAATDWSWGALIFDMDLDGKKDIFVSNGIYRDITDLDFVDFIGDQANVKSIVSKTGRSDFRDFVKLLPYNKQVNYAFINQGNLKFENQAKFIGLGMESFSNGSAYGDLDNDGDYDLVVNNVNMPAFVYKNGVNTKSDSKSLKVKLTGSKNNPQGIGTVVKIYHQGESQVMHCMPSRGFQSSVDPDLIFGLGKFRVIDSLLVIWSDLRMQKLIGPLPGDQVLKLYYDQSSETVQNTQPAKWAFVELDSSVFFTAARHQENTYNDFDHERLMPHMLSTEGPKLIPGDVNGDNQTDILITGSANEPNKLYLKTGNHYVLSKQDFFELDKQFEDVCGAFFDADNDRDLDLVLGVGGNEYQKGFGSFAVRIYYNDGKGNFERRLAMEPFAFGQISCIRPHDFNQDGKTDLFIGAKAVPGAYGLTPRSFLIRNDGQASFIDVTSDDTGPLGMVTDAVWDDINKDKMTDLIVVGEWMPITILLNSNGFLTKDRIIPNSNGWWNAIKAVDLDQDGDNDYILGNWGQNFRFKASVERPLRISVASLTSPRIKSPEVLGAMN